MNEPYYNQGLDEAKAPKQSWLDQINNYPDNGAVSIYSDAWAKQSGINPMQYPELYSDEYLESMGVRPDTYRAIKRQMEVSK